MDSSTDFVLRRKRPQVVVKDPTEDASIVSGRSSSSTTDSTSVPSLSEIENGALECTAAQHEAFAYATNTTTKDEDTVCAPSPAEQAAVPPDSKEQTDEAVGTALQPEQLDNLLDLNRETILQHRIEILRRNLQEQECHIDDLKRQNEVLVQERLSQKKSAKAKHLQIIEILQEEHNEDIAALKEQVERRDHEIEKVNQERNTANASLEDFKERCQNLVTALSETVDLLRVEHQRADLHEQERDEARQELRSRDEAAIARDVIPQMEFVKVNTVPFANPRHELGWVEHSNFHLSAPKDDCRFCNSQRQS
jgi:hypothetical protein